MKRYRKVYNDGYLLYGMKTTKRDGKGKKIMGDFIEKGRLAFAEVNRRESDYQLAEVATARLDVKIRTHYPTFLQQQKITAYKVYIHSKEYDVIRVDPDLLNQELYWYLQEVGV